MMSETFVIDNNEVSVHLNDRIPAEIAENFKEFFPEDGDLSLEEVLLQQVLQIFHRFSVIWRM